MKEKDKGQVKTWPIMKRLFLFTKPHLLWLVIPVFAAILVAVVNIIFAIGIRGLIDAAVVGDTTKFWSYILLMTAAVSLEIPGTYFRNYGAGRFAEYSLFDIRQKTTDHINHLPISYIDTHPTGDLVSRLTSDVNIIQQFLQGSMGDLVAQPVLFIGSIIFLFVMSWKLTLVSFIAIPLMMWITVKMSKPVEKYAKQQQEALSEVNSIAQDSITGLTVVKSFTLEKIIGAIYHKSVNQSVAKGIKVVTIQSLLIPGQILMQIVPLLLVFGYGGYLTVQGEMSFGSLIAFINLSNNVMNPLYIIPRAVAALRSAIATSNRIFEIWDVQPERIEGERFELGQQQEIISFRDVNFSYEGKSNILDNMSFTIQKGEKVALVGPSGCGKSTILKLVTGFYKADTGEIYLYHEPFSKWKPEAICDQLALVSQDTYLFPGTIYDNIAYGCIQEANEMNVAQVVRAAGLHNFIETLPERYATQVGERGVKLSGGQRQRIAIARALLKNAPVLLLDEATSSLDTESEQAVQDALEDLMKERTTLMIAHRLSTIKNATRILVMNEGHIVESGTHEELIALHGLYSQLYEKQFATQSDVEEQSAAAMLV